MAAWVSDRAWTQHAKPSVQIFGIIFSSRQIIRFEKFHVVWLLGLGALGLRDIHKFPLRRLQRRACLR